MNTKMTHKARLMIYSLGLLIIIAGLGLATGRNPQSGVPDSCIPFALVQAPAPAMSMQTYLATAPAPPQQKTPIIAVNRTFPQPLRGPYPPLATLPAFTTTPPAASLLIEMLPFQEAHWQGLEVIPLTLSLGQSMKISPDAKGVIVDEATAPADMEGFQAGDLITSVGQIPTPTLESFIEAADRVRDRRRTEVRLLRQGQLHSLVLTAFQDRLGTANGETAPMIKPGNRAPHGYMGLCTQCHRIGTKGQLAADHGDLLTTSAPPIRADQAPPHRHRGECTACHKIIQ